MTSFTLTYTPPSGPAVEQSIAKWNGSLDAQLECSNLEADILSITCPGSVDGPYQFAWGQPVILRRDRAYAAGVWSGGSIMFSGRVITPRRVGRGQEEKIEYRFAGPWWDLKRLVFQQLWWTQFGGAMANNYCSDVYLGISQALSPMNSGQVIAEVLDWAITCGVNLQIGTIDLTTQIPIQNVRDTTVAEIIEMIVRWNPDTACWFDYTTSPPTFHCRSLANLVNVDVPAAGMATRDVSLMPKYDLVLPSVCLRYRSTGNVNGRPTLSLGYDNYPPEATGKELGACVATIDLYGMQQQDVTATLRCAAVGAQAEDNATRVAWWTEKDPLFASANIDATSLTITTATITDYSGQTISLAALPNELISGQIAPWMSLGGAALAAQRGTVRALATYDLYADAAHKVPLQMGRTKELSVKVQLTNAVTGEYWALQSYTAPETMPTGLAQSIFASHSALQHEGSVTLIGAEVPTGVAMGNALTLHTATATYAGLLIQSTIHQLGRNLLTCHIGPAKHLSIPDLI